MSKGHNATVGQVKDHARRGATRVSPLLVALGRFGYAAEGVVYGLIGLLAFQVALGRGGATTDNKGALTQIAGAPFGRFLLIAIIAGFIGYAIWRFLQAGLDTDDKGSDAKGIAKRVGYVATGIAHIAFALSAVRLLQSGSAGTNSGTSAQGWTATLLSKPFGQALVILAGLAVLGMAGYQFYQALKAKFRKNAETGRMGAREERAYTILGRVGFAARGFVFVVIGLFLIIAARDANPNEARGLDSALATLAAQPFGPWLLGAVALGLIAYGLYLLAEARYHKIRVT
jgi:hypothetical protein